MEPFRMLGVMLDCSRNAVLRPEELYRFIDILAKMGYNTLQLYTEDTYEVEGEPYFGYLRGRYTGEELRAIDAYCRERGIELQPCIQTLAHLNAITRWNEYLPIIDQKDVLLVGEEKTYELIDRMFASLAKNFTSRRVHIGMDEAHDLGRGKFLDKNGNVPRAKILCDHLARVCEIAEKYGFRPMMWGDMFYRIANDGQYYGKKLVMTDEARNMVPEKLDLVYWDYYHEKVEEYDLMLDGYGQFNKCNETVFAGGAWCWVGFTPHNDFSMRATRAAFTSCRSHGVRDVLLTMWGDDGGECSPYAVLPSLFYAAELSRGNEDMASIKERFREIVGEDFDKMMALDLPDRVGKGPFTYHNMSKCGLYNDPFRGILDCSLTPGDSAHFRRSAKKLRAYAREGGEFAYLFDQAAKLCSILEVKYELGLRLRAAYRAGDREALLRGAADLRRSAKRLRIFYETYRDNWMKEKKPHGFEIQQYRMAGMEQRLYDCARMIDDYLAGKLARLEELEEELLPIHGEWSRGRQLLLLSWRMMNTPSVLTHL